MIMAQLIAKNNPKPCKQMLTLDYYTKVVKNWYVLIFIHVRFMVAVELLLDNDGRFEAHTYSVLDRINTPFETQIFFRPI